MKVCTKCLKSKDESEFTKNCKYKDKLSYWCKACWIIIRKQFRDFNLEKLKRLNREKMARNVKWLQDLKCKPCLDCGKKYEPYCMDFDHIPERGNKIDNISTMVLANHPKEKILQEIAKCDLICLLCHNKRTFQRCKVSQSSMYAERNKKIINEFKNKPCVICNIQYEKYNMQIDHIDPATKLYDVCQLKNFKESTLQAELEKCQVICALCHRRKSILDQKAGKYNITRVKAAKKKVSNMTNVE